MPTMTKRSDTAIPAAIASVRKACAAVPEWMREGAAATVRDDSESSGATIALPSGLLTALERRLADTAPRPSLIEGFAGTEAAQPRAKAAASRLRGSVNGPHRRAGSIH